MENNSGTQGGNQNNPKQSGLSWSQPSSAKPVSTITGTASAQVKSQPMLKPATPAKEKGTRRPFVIFAAGVVVGGLLAWSWFSAVPESAVVTENTPPAASGSTGENSATVPANTSGAALPGAVINNEALVVPSPQDAGLSVAVTNATVSSPTWVVVYESNNGVRGNALGAALFFPQGGTRTIKLLRATTAGKTYLIGRHVDNGDKQFSMTLDKPVVNAAGNPVYAEFKTR